ncbi:unnamed protein product [Ectocarpus sp. CCAP 1310/34]|nr:unnamed protein product [Ectocarpus sp. CCAP 1310/34]
MKDALRLCVSCADALAQEGEFICARRFYTFVADSCEGIKRERTALTPPAAEGATPKTRSTCLAQDEASWMARAEFGAASMELRVELARDPHVQFAATLTKVTTHLRRIQNAMQLMLNRPKDEHDAVSWVVLEGCVILFDWCEPLSALGHGDEVVEFLAWSTLAMESMVSLSTVKHLPWRTRLAVATCYAFEDSGKPAAAAKCAAHALKKVRELRRQEEMDPPIPPNVTETLDVAESDLTLLTFKYTTLATAAAKRPPSSTVGGTNEGGDNTGGTGDESVEGGLCEEDLRGLLDEHVSALSGGNVSASPRQNGETATALLELIGSGDRRSTSSVNGSAGTLTASESSLACKLAVSLLLLPAPEEREGEEEVTNDAEVDLKKHELLTGEESIDNGIDEAFPLYIDQELMREMYQLGEFQAWEAMLPSTKRRLRQASKGSLGRNECRAFWFEIALWTSCKRLQTWRDKPEPSKPAEKGVLKRTPPASREGSSNPISSTQTATERSSDSGDSGDCSEKERGGSCASLVLPAAAEGEKRRGVSKGVVVMGAEEELRESLKGTRPAEVVEVALGRDGTVSVRVNLTPMLTVVDLLRKALFGHYRHLLESRGEALLDATMLLWEPYVASILEGLDGLPGEAEIDLPLLDALLLSLETICACLSALNADDESLRATVALRLAILQADFRGDRRKACQTLRSALASIDKHRKGVICNHLHHATTADDTHGNCSTGTRSSSNTRSISSRRSSALTRASVTASFHNEAESINSTRGNSGDGGGNARGDWEVEADMGFQELVALQLVSDITSTLFRVELLMGRDTACQLAKHQKAEAAARLAARRNASKRKRPPNKASKVTFGDSDGRLDTRAGSLAAGWSVVLPVGVGGPGNGSDGSTGGVTKALTGSNAIVCAAGAGPLLTKAAAALEGAKQGGEICLAPAAPATTKGKDGPGLWKGDEVTGLCVYCLGGLLIVQAKATEKVLLGMMPAANTGGEDSADARRSLSKQPLPDNNKNDLNNNNRRASIRAPPPAPLLVSRSHNSIELLPLLFPPSRQHQHGQAAGKKDGRGVDGGDHVVETTLELSNATSTTAAMSRHAARPPAKARRVVKVFAVAAFDEQGNLIGEGIGEACSPVETLNPLPLPLCWAHLSRTALGLGCSSLAAQAATEVYRELMTLAAGNLLTSSSARKAGRHGVVGRTANSGAKATKDVPTIGGTVTTDLRDGWMASPLVGQAFEPEALDRCPRGVLQVLCQLHQCLSLVPRGDGWDNVIKSTFACLAYQITIKGHEIGENLVARATLLDHGPDGDHTASAGAVVFMESSPTAPGVGAAEGADEDEGSVPEGETRDLSLKNGTPAQAALLEVWMGLQGYGMAAGGEAGGATTDFSKLRKALDLEDSDSATSASPFAGGGGNAGEEDALVAPIPSLEVMSCAHKNPAKAWELLQGEAFTSHSDRARLMCRVCWIALDRGMAQQVVSWLDPGELGATGAGTTAEDRAAGGTEAGERGCAHVLAESDLKPLAAKVLALEGGLEDLPYIVPAPGNKDTGMMSVEAAQGIDEGADNSKGNAGGEAAAVTDEGDIAEAEKRGTNVDPGDRSDRSSNTRGEGDECMDALTLAASTAESEQLLRLAEVEHILGAACLQLGLAAAATVGASKLATGRPTANGQVPSLHPQPAASAGAIAANPVSSIPAGVAGVLRATPPVEASRPTVKEVCAAAGGGRLPWGYGTGPFAEVFASKNELVVEGGGGGRDISGDGGGDRGGDHGRDEEDIISQLEDDGTPWPSKNQTISAVEGAVISENNDEGNSAGGNGDNQHGKSADGDAFAVFFSMAMLHLTKAASRARHAHSWSKTERSCGLLWNAILALWLSPQDFRSIESAEVCVGWGLPLGEHHGRIYAKACEALLDAVDAAHGIDRGGDRRGLASNRGSSQESADDDSSEHEGGVGLKARLEAIDEKFKEAQAKRRRRKVLKALETKSKEEIEHERAREPLVEDVGNARVRKQIHDHRLGTLLQSRDNYAKTKEIGRRILDDARETLVKHLALLSPTPSPLASSESPTAGDGNVLRQELANGSVPPTDNDIRDGDGVGDTPDFRLVEKSESAVLKVYGRAVGVLRDKRERELLTEALCDMGDLHALGGHYDSASKSWMDAIDNLCSALDSTKHWRSIFSTLRAAHPSSGGPHGGGGSLALALGRWSCIAGGTLLGKLSRFTGQNDMRGQLNLCLMAAEMFRAPMEISLPYPQRECDYASFTPETLGGPGLESLGLWIDDRRLSVSSLSLSLMHVQGVLVAAGCYKEAFPVQAVLEHVASKVTLDPLQLVRVQLARAECLAEAGFPAEAASALAAVLSGGSTPKTTAGYAGRRYNVNSSKDPPPAPAEAETPVAGKGKAKKGVGTKGKGGGKSAADSTVEKDSGVSVGAEVSRARDPRDMAKSGLPFYGFAPFRNSLPLGHPDNAPAVSWLVGELPGIGADDTSDATGEPSRFPSDTNESADKSPDQTVSMLKSRPRHVRLLKRGLFGVNPTLEELQGENEACLVARARARLLLALADCSATLPSEDGEGRSNAREGEGDADVLKRVRDAADSILGEVLQVTFKRISPAAIPTPTAPLDTGRSGKSAATQESSLSVHPDGMESGERAATEAAHMAATAPDQPDGWAPPMAADALLMRGRLALLDGKFRVCRHHASRGLAVLLRHGLGEKGGKSFPPHRANGATASMGKLTTGASSLSSGRQYGDNDNTDGSIQHAMAMKNAGGTSGGHSRVMLDDEQRQPWRVIRTWLELRHDLAAVALLQGRTTDAMLQIRRGLDEAHAVGEGVISNRLRRLGAQAAVAEGNLEQAVSDCQALATDYINDPSTSAVDLAAVLRLMAKIRHQQSLVSGEGDRRQALLLVSEALDALRIADQGLLSAANGLGWIGSGVLTYSQREDNSMDADAKPHLLHALGTSFRDLSRELPGDVAFGLAPADESDETAQSSLANLYLPALRLLLTVRVTLLDIIEGVGPHNAEREELERRQSCGSEGDNERSFQQQHGDVEENNLAGTVGTTGEGWLAGASSLAEETMATVALLRHIAHPHPALRAHLLLLVGTFRLRQLKNIQGTSSSSSRDPMGSTATTAVDDDSAGVYALTHGSHLPRMGSPDTSILEAATATALTAALRVSFWRGGHDWRVMSDACMSLVVLYYITAAKTSRSIENGEHLSDDDKNGASLHAAGADDGQELHRHKMGLFVHYLRLAASISLGHRRLSIELDSIASDPLPAAVIDNMPRSALDELAGRGGRGPEDDPLRLSTRGLLQFLRARVHEKSLAAAPVDLLPASVVCQIHALLYRHVPLYRKKCCIQASSLDPPSAPETVGEASSSADVASVLSPAVICVQWIWGDFHGIGARGSSTAGSTLVGADDDGDQTVTGLYPARTAFILLGPGQPNAADEKTGQKGPLSGSEFGPSILVARVLSSSADGLRRRASQLKALLSAIEKKRSADATAAAVESGGPPLALKDRFNLLLQDAAQALRSGLVAPPLTGPEAEKGTVESGLAPTKSKEPAAAAEAPGSSSDQEAVMALTVDNVGAVEGVFNTDIGVDVENEQLCRFLRAATTTTTKISASP